MPGLRCKSSFILAIVLLMKCAVVVESQLSVDTVSICSNIPASEIRSLESQNYKLPVHFISPVYVKQNITGINLRFISFPELLSCKDRIDVRMNTNNASSENLTTYFIPGGRFQHDDDIYDTSEFCIQSVTLEALTIQICNQKCAKGERSPFCIPKCCEIGEVLSIQGWDAVDVSEDANVSCTDSGGKKWVYSIYSDPYTKLPAGNIKPKFWINSPNAFCSLDAIGGPDILTLEDLPSSKRRPFRILQDGKVVAKFTRFSWTDLEPGKFCMDDARFYLQQSISENDQKQNNGFKSVSVLYDCSETFHEYEAPAHQFWYGSAALVSATCLLITLLFNLHIMDNKKSHRKIILSYVLALLGMELFIGAGHFLPHFAGTILAEGDSVSNQFCYGIAIGAHLFYILAFCWMTAVNFDIWMTMRNLEGKLGDHTWRFVLSALFCCGTALIITGTGVVLDILYRDDLEGTIIIPEYGRQSCFLEPIHASLLYVYIPVGTLLIANTIFFVLTIYNIQTTRRETQQVQQQKNTSQPNSAAMIFKLCIIMGIPWIMEVISWALTHEDSEIPPHFIVSDLFILLQGISILYIFCFATTPRKKLRKKYPFLNRMC